jgi:3-oxoacyl-[acyl-carrier protein] reductase
MLLNDKVAVVTGATRGIGDAMTRTFLAHGARVIALVRDPAASQTVEWLSDLEARHGGRIQTIALDLADEDSVKAAVKAVVAATPRLDVLVNNAGAASYAIVPMTSMAELRRMFDVNFFGHILLSQGLARLMARKKAGSIINIVSTAALDPDPGTLAYGASKAALLRATLSEAAEFGASGIRVNAIAPGPTHTDMYEQIAPAMRDRFIQSSALKRAGEPQDVANAALFLASDLSTYITGQVLRVDGGMA